MILTNNIKFKFIIKKVDTIWNSFRYNMPFFKFLDKNIIEFDTFVEIVIYILNGLKYKLKFLKFKI
jgi:hypothetical protein